MRKILLMVLMVLLMNGVVCAFEEDGTDPFLSQWTVVGSWSVPDEHILLSSSSNAEVKNLSALETGNYFSIDINYTASGTAPWGDDFGTLNIYAFSNATSNKGFSLGLIDNVYYLESCTGFTCDSFVLDKLTNYNFVLWVPGSNMIFQITNLSSNTIVYDHTYGVNLYSPDRIIINRPTEGNGAGDNAHSMTVYLDNIILSSSNPDSASTGSISFDADNYNLGDIAYIDATLTNPDYDTYGYRTIIYNPDGSINHAHMWAEPTTSQAGFSINIEQLGTYTVKIQRFTDLFSYTDLDTDTAVGKYQNDALMSVYFNDSYYNTGDTVLIQSNISNINNSLYFYEIMIIKPNGNFYNVHNITANESYSFITNVPGEWQVSLTSYPKSDSSMIENQVSDYMVTYGTGVGASWVSFNDTYYNKNSWARMDYGISVNDFYDSHKMQITNQEGTVVFDRQIIAQSGYFDYYFYESGKYTVTIDRNWFALDWDLTDNEILATDVTEVTNTIEGGFTLGITPTTLNCGQTVYLSADTPNVWNTSSFQIKNVSGIIMTDISGQAGSWKTNQTGQFWVYLNDGGAIQDTGYFYVYGTCTGYDQMNPDGSGGIKPKPYPQTDQATSNAALQNNLLYFMGLPIFWGMILFCGILITAATLNAGRTIPYLAPVIIMFELVIGLLDPYSSYIAVGFGIVLILYFIANFAIGYQQGSS